MLPTLWEHEGASQVPIRGEFLELGKGRGKINRKIHGIFIWISFVMLQGWDLVASEESAFNLHSLVHWLTSLMDKLKGAQRNLPGFKMGEPKCENWQVTSLWVGTTLLPVVLLQHKQTGQAEFTRKLQKGTLNRTRSGSQREHKKGNRQLVLDQAQSKTK